MNLFGETLLFLTAFLWSWGAETSKKIQKYEGYHSQAFTFWGGYHRFNHFILKLARNDVQIASLIAQGLLGAIFFLPVVAIGGAWYYWWYLVLGGMSFVTFKKIWTKKKES